MKANIKKRWIKALRSGKYKQGMGKLRGEGNHCCLGVLCDITKKETGGYWNGDYFINGTSETSNCLPDFVMNELDMPNSNNGGSLKKKYKANNGVYYITLFELNDKGKSFKQIANIIEKNF